MFITDHVPVFVHHGAAPRHPRSFHPGRDGAIAAAALHLDAVLDGQAGTFQVPLPPLGGVAEGPALHAMAPGITWDHLMAVGCGWVLEVRQGENVGEC